MPIWSEEVVVQLRSLAEQGFSASQAAANFVGMTRNSAVGLAFRRKFHFAGGKGGGPNHVASGEPKKKRERMISFPKRSYRKVPEVVIALSVAVTEADVAPRRKVSILELTEQTCRFPLGDPLAPDFGYCGAKPHPNYPYCPSCCILAYEQPENRHARSEPGRTGSGRFPYYQVRHGRILNGGL